MDYMWSEEKKKSGEGIKSDCKIFGLGNRKKEMPMIEMRKSVEGFCDDHEEFYLGVLNLICLLDI